jgi:ribosomal protein S27AE
MDYPEYLEPCPACGDHADYCQGHGEMGDPVGHAILAAHYDRGEHGKCHPLADCEV